MSYNSEDLLDFICKQTGKTRSEWSQEFKTSGNTIPWYFKDERPSWFPVSKWRDPRYRFYSRLGSSHCFRNSTVFNSMKELGLTHRDFPRVRRITAKHIEEKLELKTGIKEPLLGTEK